jgi:hypothetical protein
VRLDANKGAIGAFTELGRDCNSVKLKVTLSLTFKASITVKVKFWDWDGL